MVTRSIPLLTDEQLIELLKNGDRKAGDAIVQRHNRLVARAVYDVVRDLAAVEDLIQDIFMKAFRKIGLYHPEQGKFTVWLTTVSRNEAINHLRRMKRSRHVSLEDERILRCAYLARRRRQQRNDGAPRGRRNRIPLR